MDGGLVSDTPPNKEGGQAPLYAYTEKFYEVFPYYLAIGMTYEQFWEMDCELVKYYRKAAKIKQDLDNQQAWLQGAYFYEALADVSPILHAFAKKGAKPIPYRDSPYPVGGNDESPEKKEKEEKNDNRAKAVMEMFMIANNKKFEPGGDKHG